MLESNQPINQPNYFSRISIHEKALTDLDLQALSKKCEYQDSCTDCQKDSTHIEWAIGLTVSMICLPMILIMAQGWHMDKIYHLVHKKKM